LSKNNYINQINDNYLEINGIMQHNNFNNNINHSRRENYSGYKERQRDLNEDEKK
jgi:hypothetical protein